MVGAVNGQVDVESMAISQPQGHWDRSACNLRSKRNGEACQLEKQARQRWLAVPGEAAVMDVSGLVYYNNSEGGRISCIVFQKLFFFFLVPFFFGPR